MSLEKRYGFIGIVVNSDANVLEVQSTISKFNQFILGRMGLPMVENSSLSVITLIIYATTDEVGKFTGALGKIKGIKVKSAVH